MKKIIALILTLSLILSTMVTASASTISKNEIALNNAVEKIADVNGLSDSEKETLYDSLSEKVLILNDKELKELDKSMKGLDKEYKALDKEKTESINETYKAVYDVTSTSAMSSRTSFLLTFTYVGKILAPVSGFMMMCDDVGFDLVKQAILGIGGGLAALGTAFTKGLVAAGVTVSPYFAVVAGAMAAYIIIMIAFVEIQLILEDYAILFI